MKSALRLLCILPLVSGLAACHVFSGLNSCNSTQPYMSARSVPPLVIPAGLDLPDTSAALRIPPLNEPAPPRRTRRDSCLENPPPFKTSAAARPQA